MTHLLWDKLPRLAPVVVAALAVLAAPAAGSGQAVRNPTQQDPVGTLNLVRGEADPAPSLAETVPRGYALVIGVGDYPRLQAHQQLEFAATDAREMYRVLIAEGGEFPAENVRVLTDEDASLANIREALEEWLPSVARPSDRVVVYFVGHGFVENGVGYLAPSDADPDRLAETGYPMAKLGEVMANLPAGWKALFTDACHSGKVNGETTEQALHEQLNDLPQNFLNFSAAREREEAHYDRNLAGGFGVFTYYLTRALRGDADHDPCDRLVSANEAIDYVRTNVQEWARNRRARGRDVTQTPTERGDFDGRMVLGVRRSGDDGGCVPIDVPHENGTAIVEVNFDDVDIYVDDRFRGTASEGQPLRLPGLRFGVHRFRAERRGYEPAVQERTVPAGGVVTVTLRIIFERRESEEARDLIERGERLLYTRRSTVNPLNILPVRRRQSREDLEEARDLFLAALRVDPQASRAARALGEAYQLLDEPQKSQAAYRSALDVHPNDADARVQLAALLVEAGTTITAFQQLEEARALGGLTDQHYSRMASAYWRTGAWEQTRTFAQRAIDLNASSQGGHLYRAEALRQLAAAEFLPTARQSLFRASRQDYRKFLELTNFESSLGERLLFHFVGFGLGRRSHADRERAYLDLRATAYLGLCITERSLDSPLRSREYCESAIQYNEDFAAAHLLLGSVELDLYNLYFTCDHLTAARSSYDRMLEINPDHGYAGRVQVQLEQITIAARELGCAEAP